ncbi:DUF2613 family protein [Mycobacterium sp.]|uniref:DUF2613 family protein n=1 Tax=Mycobacterium sp. TaxID=1785 RepID=UPI002CA98E17|nr:DUF2613 family protein [Mycobacterium sp.]HTY32682.1 DUF2613 family protein [Mycobacterium sp.]
MAGFSLAAAASIAVGLSIGAAATVGVTLAVDGHTTAPSQSPPTPRNPSGPYLVDYGDRCFHGHCLPCDSKQSCLDQLPPGLRP